jgi:hypothetical protein
MALGDSKGPFYRLPNEKFIYKWSPQPYEPKKRTGGKGNMKIPCTATPGSQGEDFVTTYVYKLQYSPNGDEHRYAYVECDYVE